MTKADTYNRAIYMSETRLVETSFYLSVYRSKGKMIETAFVTKLACRHTYPVIKCRSDSNQIISE